MHRYPCQIVLSTYNGELYLKAQLDSLFLQTNQQWTLLIRDDGSTDNSIKIIKEYEKKYPNRIQWLPDSLGNLGTLCSMTHLLKATTADYVFTCDQDDYWLKDKVQISLDAMQKAVQQHGQQTPLLVYTDLQVGDSNLKIIHPSYFKKHHLQPEKLKSLASNMLNIYCSGATMLLNQALIQCIQLPLHNPDLLIRNLQDWWFNLYAVSLGKIITVHKPLMIYRLHNFNNSAKKQAHMHQHAHFLFKILLKYLPQSISQYLVNGWYTTASSKSIVEEFLKTLPQGSSAYEAYKTYLEVCNKSFFGRKWGFIKHRYHRQNWIRTLVAFCLF